MKVFKHLRLPVLASLVCVACAVTAGAANAESAAKQVSRIAETDQEQNHKLGRDWIEKMSRAMQNLNYAGTFV